MSEVMKAIRLTQLENELVDIRRQIAKIEGIINSTKCSYKFKNQSKKLLPALVKKRDNLINQITEESLLHETESNLV